VFAAVLVLPGQVFLQPTLDEELIGDTTLLGNGIDLAA
jgi:hypothetical protein